MSVQGLFTVRFGTPADIDAIGRFELEYFPAVAGEHHAGYLFENRELAERALTEAFAANERIFVFVAESAGETIGFAAAVPSRLPGLGEIDRTSMLLQYIAVQPQWRRRGVAAALLREVERRSLAARQNVIVAHVPDSAAEFYRHEGWSVIAHKRGFAWVPFKEHVRADVPDPGLGFPRMAAKVLRPGMIQHTFDFPIRLGAPIADAVAELVKKVDAGEIERRTLNSETQEFLTMPLPQPPRPGASFGIR